MNQGETAIKPTGAREKVRQVGSPGTGFLRLVCRQTGPSGTWLSMTAPVSLKQTNFLKVPTAPAGASRGVQLTP